MPACSTRSLLRAIGVSALALAGTLRAQPGAAEPPAQPQPAAEPAADAPRLELEKNVLDWGDVSDQAALKAEIKFKNTGKSKLQIVECKPSCGCVRPKLRANKREYEPGEEGVIEVEFEPLNKQGPLKDLNIAIRSNDPLSPAQKIEIKGDVRPTVGIETPDGLSLGAFDAGTEKTLRLYIFGRLPEFKATFATISAESGFSVKIGKTETVEMKGEKVQRTEVFVTAEKNARIGRFSHQVVIRHTDKRIRNGLWEVTVAGDVLNDVRAEPAEIDMGAMSMTEDFKFVFKLTNVKGDAFKVLEHRFAPTRGGTIDLAMETAPGDKPNEVKVTLAGKSPARPGACEGLFQFRTDIKGLPAVKVPFKLTVRPPTNGE